MYNIKTLRALLYCWRFASGAFIYLQCVYWNRPVWSVRLYVWLRLERLENRRTNFYEIWY